MVYFLYNIWGCDTMKNQRFTIEFTNERLITPSGLAIVGGMLGKSDLVNRLNRIPVDQQKRSEPQIKNGDIALTYIGLLTQGKTQYEAVKEMREDPEYFKDALGVVRAIPSAETLRQRMDDIGDSRREDILQANLNMFTAQGVKPSPLACGLTPLDIDVSPFDNSKSFKEGVSRTYKGCDGYAPIFAYLGTEGFLVNAQLREGKQHCQKGTPDFLRETLLFSHQMTSDQLLIRLDSGNDAAENLGILLEDGSWFIVKRNLRKESKDAWLNETKECCKDIRYPREGKTVYIGSSWKNLTYTCPDGERKTVCLRIGYEIVERTIDKHGQVLLVPDIEVNTWWTNLGWTDDEVIASYHAHGECEQYHSEIKTDMDVERLPSGKFPTNCLVLELTILAYNLLRMIGQESLKHRPPEKKSIKRRRLRTVIQNLILCASHITNHARKLVMGLGRSNVWRYAFKQIYLRFVLN